MRRTCAPFYTILFFSILLFFVPFKVDLSGMMNSLAGFGVWNHAEAEDPGQDLFEEAPLSDEELTNEVGTTEVYREGMDDNSYSYCIPYYISNSGYWTGVGLKNGNTSSSASVTATVYDTSGTVISTESKTIPARGQVSFMVGAGKNKEGWVGVTSSQPLTGLAFVTEKEGDALMFDIPFVSELTNTLYIPHVAQDTTWDTIVYVCNPHGSATTMYLTFFDSDGTLVKVSNGYILPVNGSGKYPLSDLLGKTHYTSGSVRITASQGVAAFALYHNTKISCDPNILVTKDYWTLKSGYQANYDNGETVSITEQPFTPLGQDSIFQTAFSGLGSQLRKYDTQGNLIHYGYVWDNGYYYIVDKPVSLLPSTLELNKVYERDFLRSEYNRFDQKQGDYTSTYTMTVTGPETIPSLVPGYASFQVYKLHLVDYSMNPNGSNETKIYDYWLARKIGIVKMTREGSTSSMTSCTEPYDPGQCFKSLSYAGISAVIPQAGEKGSYNYYLPYVFSNKAYWTGVGLRNGSTTDSASVTVTGIKQNGSAFDSQVRTIPAQGQTAFMMKTGEGWGLVTSDQPLTGLGFIAMAGDDKLMFDIPFVSELAKTLYVPHVAQDATWDTIVYVCNPHGSETTIYLTYVKPDGTVVTSKKYTLSVNGSGKYSLSGVLGSSKYTGGSIEITASQGVAAFALYHNTKTGLRSYAGINAVVPGESCAYSINPTSQSFDSASHTGSVAITSSSSSCAWTAVSNNASWLHVTSGSSGTGSGTVSYSVDANSSTSTRTGTLTIAGKTFTVTQPGKTSCTYSISPTSKSFTSSAGTGSVSVTASSSSCAWTAASNNASWLHVTSGSSGTGSGTVSYSVDANSSTSTRTGTLTIAGKTFTVTQTGKPGTFTNSIGMTFVPIPAGTFMMGSPTSESLRYSNETLHQVTLTKSFYMQTTEVTQGQWKAVMGSNPSYFSNCGDNCPVDTVSWDDCQSFISKLNQKEGATKYRLPTEAEWEYACRAGTTTPFSTGSCLSTSQANYDGNYPYTGCPSGTDRKAPVLVKSFSPNAWGLYDMHGNVWEWCSDWYGDYPGNAVTDPDGSSNGTARVLRGGCYINLALYCRSANRNWRKPGFSDDGLGFRVAIDSSSFCVYTITQTSKSFTDAASSGSVSVTTSSGCAWTAVSNNSTWLHVTAGSSGTGSGTVSYSVDANTSTSSRTGTLTIAGNTFTVTQSAKVTLTETVSLSSGDSFDFTTGIKGQYTGGDLYFINQNGQKAFWANNLNQKGLVDIGNIGQKALNDVIPPESGYYRFGVSSVVGHTYVSMLHEGYELEGKNGYVIFKVLDQSRVTVYLEYFIKILP